MAVTTAIKSRLSGWIKTALGAVLGIVSGAAAMYGTAIVDRVVKPSKPVANFAASADGLTLTCQNFAAGESGWWDFGDGSPLEPFNPQQQTQSHTYAKAGSYTVKLIVRNFLSEENERSVPVDVVAAATPQSGPTITGLQVEPIGPRAIAPAAFRIRGEVKNSEKIFVDLGDRVEVATETGPFERLVVFDKPGQYPIQLIGYNGKVAVKQGSMVTVAAPAVGSISVVMKVLDFGSKVDRQTFTESLPMSAPSQGSKAERVIQSRPGYTIVEAKFGTPMPANLKNPQLEIGPDRRTVKIVGEWAGNAVGKNAPAAEAIVPVQLIEEKTVAVSMPAHSTAGSFTLAGGTQSTVSLSMPPKPTGMTNPQRRTQLEFREATADGRSRVLMTVPEVTFPWTGMVKSQSPTVGATGMLPTTAKQVGDQIVIQMGY